MKLPLSHQRFHHSELFGLFASRFLYNEGPHKQPQSPVQEMEERVASKVESVKELQLQELKETIADYNSRYGEHIAEKDRNKNFHYETLIADTEDLERTFLSIGDAIYNLKYNLGDDWQDKLKKNPELEAQLESLQAIYSTVDALRKLDERGAEAVREVQRGQLYEGHERMMKVRETKEMWAKKEAYQEIKNVFETTCQNQEFEWLFQSPDGLVSQNQREARELFMAIMAEKTNGFEHNFVLDEGFGNNPEANVQNFPFLYNEFMKHEGDLIAGEAVSFESIHEAQSRFREAGRRLNGESAQDVIANIQSGGARPGDLGPMPAIPNNEGWEQRIQTLKSWHYSFRERAAAAPDMPQKDPQIAAARKLEMHIAYAEAGLKLSRLRTREDVVRSRFTRAELSKRPSLAITLAMKKFLKAQEIVDHPYGASSDWRYNLHPTVRRMLIASTYDSDVGVFEETEKGNQRFRETPQPRHHWMLAKLALTDYFNFKEVGEKMDETHLALLRAAFVGGEAAELLSHAEEVDNLLTDWIKVLEKAETVTDKEARRKLYKERMAHYPPKYAALYVDYNINQAKEAQGKLRTDMQTLEEFLKEADYALQHPYGKDDKDQRAQNFIEEMKQLESGQGSYAGVLATPIDRIGQMALINGASLREYMSQMKNLDINFRTAELGEKNMLQFFEGMGLNIKGLYPKYLNMIEENPGLQVQHWDRLLLGSEAEYQSLMEMLKVIINHNKTDAKENFLAGLVSLRRKYKGKQLNEIQSQLQEGSEDAAIINIFKMLQQHLSERGEMSARGALAQKDIEARMNGMHVGDKISYYVGGVWDMLTGPGQSPANRLAGLVLMYGMYKSARMAMKGEGPMGKALRALFVAGSLEIAMKEVTGRGVLDRLGLDTIAGAMMGNTYEAVLLHDAKEDMEAQDISEEAHTAALLELRGVPFDKVVEWYETVDPQKGVIGEDNPDKRRTSNDKFPKGIDLSAIAKKLGQGPTDDSDVRVKHVVYHTVKHFFKYVGSKENNRSVTHAKEALKERWITMYDKRDYKPVYSSYDHLEWFESGRVQKSDITWDLVMRCQIDPSEVDLTRDQTMVGQLSAKANEVAEDAYEWAQAHVMNPGSEYVKELLSSGTEYSQSAKALVEEYSEILGRKAYLTERSVVLWVGQHQYQLERVAEDHWKLLVTGIKAPFQVIYAVDQWVVPWSLAKIRGIEQSLTSEKLVTTSEGTSREGQVDLSAADIAPNPLLVGSSNRERNPHYRYFGVYQEPFLRAFEAKTTPSEPMYHEDRMKVGYYIAEMSAEKAGFNPDLEPYKSETNARNAALIKAAYEDAKKFFRGKGMEDKEMHLLDQIHQVVRTGQPEKVYIFYRMPLKGSMELYLKETGHWADYMHADRIKDRPAFRVDPHLSKWENLHRSFMLDADVTRTIIHKGGAYAAQIPRFVFWNVEQLGGIIKPLAKIISDEPDKDVEEAVDNIMKRPQTQRMWMDEVFCSAMSPSLALSQFYSNEARADLYNFSLEYAKDRGKPLHLGLLREEIEAVKDYHSMYLDGEMNYGDVMDFYREHYANSSKEDPAILRRIQERQRAQAGGAARRTP